MRKENIRFQDFKSHQIKVNDMTLTYENEFYRLYTYEFCGFLFGNLLLARGLCDEGWDEEDLMVDVVYYAECHCGEIKNIWIGDEYGNIYYPQINQIFESLKALENLADSRVPK